MKHIPMLDLRKEYEYMRAEIDAALNTCLRHQRWVLGPEVKELEEKIGAYLRVKHCLGTSSGTDALVLSLRALAIKTSGREYFDRGTEIITTPFTFTATGDTILRAGATPVFVDIDPATFNMDTTLVKRYLENNDPKKVAALLPVHLYGQACRMDEITELAAGYGLSVVEDVAQAFGASWRGEKLGAIGSLGCFSFFPSKNLGGFGDGGMIATNDGEAAALARMLIKHGGKDKYNVDHIGYNARLDTLQAAVLLAKLKYIDEFNEKRKAIAAHYIDILTGVAGVEIPEALPEAGHVYHQFTLRVNRRDKLQVHLKGQGIDTMIYYPVPLHNMRVFQGRAKEAAPLAQAEKAVSSVISLPIEPLQREEDTQRVAHTVRDFYDN